MQVKEATHPPTLMRSEERMLEIDLLQVLPDDLELVSDFIYTHIGGLLNMENNISDVCQACAIPNSGPHEGLLACSCKN